MLIETTQTPLTQVNDRAANLNRRVGRVLSIMREHPEEAHTTRSLAGVAAFSPYHFNRVFRREIGIPPAQYLCAMRIQTAKRLLLTTPLSVTDVCFDVGYNSLGTFVTRFTQLVGLSPNALRRAAASFQPVQLRDACELEHDQMRQAHYPQSVRGRIHASPEFKGVIFVGLFHTLMPHAAPFRCQVLAGPGAFRLGPLPVGIYYITAAAMPWSSDITDLLMEDVPRASCGPIDIIAGSTPDPLQLVFRAPAPADPPILAAFPLLLTRDFLRSALVGPVRQLRTHRKFEHFSVV
jgi:AraC family transcriptional regulator